MAANPWIESTFDKTVTRLRASSKADQYGNTVPDWSSPATLMLAARVAPPILKPRLGSHAADEDMSGRDAIRHDLEIWVANDDVQATDRMSFDGLTYEIMGNPGTRSDLDGNYLYTKILAREVSG